MKGTSVVMVMQVWNDETGERIEVGEDRDGLGMVEIRYVSDDGKVGADIRFQPEDADKVVDAIRMVAAFMAKTS